MLQEDLSQFGSCIRSFESGKGTFAIYEKYEPSKQLLFAFLQISLGGCTMFIFVSISSLSPRNKHHHNATAPKAHTTMMTATAMIMTTENDELVDGDDIFGIVMVDWSTEVPSSCVVECRKLSKKDWLVELCWLSTLLQQSKGQLIYCKMSLCNNKKPMDTYKSIASWQCRIHCKDLLVNRAS